MKRGFTLVELIATLIVLSVVAIIVVPNIQKNINEMSKGLSEIQMSTIKNAAQNWYSDWIVSSNPDNITTEEQDTYVFLKNLKEGGYVDEKMYKDNEGNSLNDNIFVLITRILIEGDVNNNDNYKYIYEVYDTNEKHLAYLAKLYAKKNNVTSKTTVTLSNLLPLANTNLKVDSKLKNIEDGSLISSASVVISYNNNEYSFKVNID